MRENRVRVRDYGRIIRSDDPRLRSIPSVRGRDCKLHFLAAGAFHRMAHQIFADIGVELKAASGWRAHRWSSLTEYEAYLVTHYGSVARGRKWIAYDSPHETGLAVDLQCGGLQPVSKTARAQKQTLLYAWLSDHAESYGFSPYLPEPWHWEYHISLDDWRREA